MWFVLSEVLFFLSGMLLLTVTNSALLLMFSCIFCIFALIDSMVGLLTSLKNRRCNSSCQSNPIICPFLRYLPACERKQTKGLTLVQALRSRVGAKGCWRHFFKNPTTQLRVDWVLTEKKCEQTPKFACFSVQRRPLHLSQAEMLPSHAVLKEGIK